MLVLVVHGIFYGFAFRVLVYGLVSLVRLATDLFKL